MTFAYKPMDEEIERDTIVQIQHPAGQRVEAATDCHIQTDVGHHRGLQLTQPLLPSWPLAVGVMEICLGFLAAGCGAVEVFVIPMQIDMYGDWYFRHSNCYGAALWSGALLVLTGSCTVQAATRKLKFCVRRFYLMSLLSFLANIAFIILILVCYTKYWTDLPEPVHDYYLVSLLGTICCVLGLSTLTFAVFTYGRSVLCGNVRLLHDFGVCCVPCYFNRNMSQMMSLIERTVCAY